MTDTELELPQGWVETDVGIICKNHDKQRIPINAKKRKLIQGKIPYYGASGIVDYVEKPIFSGKYFLIGEDGANLISRSTPIGFIVEGDFWVNNHAHILSTYENIPLEFLSHYIASISLKPWISGTAQPKLNQENLQKIPVPLPPLNEQTRIVSKIEELFSKIDSTKQSLEQTKLQLEQYRASFLKSAFEGKLTEEWRENNPNKYVQTLLDRMIAKRTKLYLEQLENAKIKGLRKPKSKFLLKIPKLMQENNALPKSWAVTNIDFLAFVTKLAGFEYTKFFNLKSVGEIPVVKAQNVSMGKFVEKKIEYISKKISDLLPRSQIHGKEILMSFVGSVGNVCLAPNEKRWHLAPNVAKIEVDVVNREFLFYYLQSPLGNLQVHEKKKSTSQASLSMENIRTINVNISPLEEQEQIVSKIKQGFSLIENTTQIVNSTLQNLQTMKMSVLKQAFEGKLVPQDPNDESASVLLEKISKK